jgi:hypothetical protein
MSRCFVWGHCGHDSQRRPASRISRLVTRRRRRRRRRRLPPPGRFLVNCHLRSLALQWRHCHARPRSSGPGNITIMTPVPGSCSLRTLRCGRCPGKTGRACQCGAISAPGAPPRFADPSRLGTPACTAVRWARAGPRRRQARRRRPATQRLGLEASTEGGLRSHRVHIQVVATQCSSLAVAVEGGFPLRPPPATESREAIQTGIAMKGIVNQNQIGPF